MHQIIVFCQGKAWIATCARALALWFHRLKSAPSVAPNRELAIIAVVAIASLSIVALARR
jgi:hypothetical protein